MDARATGAADPAGVSAMGVRAADAADARVTDAGAVGASGAADEGGAAGAAAVHDAGAEEPFAPGDDLPDETTFSRWSSAARRAVRLSAASAELGGLTEAPADAIDMTLKGGIAKILREAARRGTTEGAPSRTSAIKGAQPTAPMQPADFVEMFGGAPKPRSEHGRSAAAARSAEGSEQEAAELAAERAAENWAAPLGSHAPEALATLEFAGGDSVPVRVPIIIGRSPNQGPQRPGEPHPQWVKVVGSTDISRNHARVEVSAGLVLVTDLHSRNGTDIILPDRPAERLRPGEPTVVVSGTVIDLGSGVAFTVRS